MHQSGFKKKSQSPKSKPINIPQWHTLSSSETAAKLGSHLTLGITHQDYLHRREIQGRNILSDAKVRSPLRILLDQFSDFMIRILIISAFFAEFLGEPKDAIAISVIVVLNAILGFVQEYRADRAMASLNAMSTQQSYVCRDGTWKTVLSSELVSGDLLALEAGNLIPADIRLVEVNQLFIDESALTGESVPVEKTMDSLANTELDLADRLNMAYKGTLATAGRARGFVVATGMGTELGRIAKLLEKSASRDTPLQQRLARFGKKLALIILALSTIIFGIGVLRGVPPLLMFMTALSLAVAAIPEALPAIVTVLLAVGARRMAKQNALIRRLPAVETLGSVTYICTDKTGTLTQNKMHVESFSLGSHWYKATIPVPSNEHPKRLRLFEALVLNNDAKIAAEGTFQGDPTESAFLVAAAKINIIKTEYDKKWSRIYEVPFSSERACMTTVHKLSDTRMLVVTKGSPEAVISRCTRQISPHSQPSALIEEPKNVALALTMASEGLRVLAVASKEMEISATFDDQKLESDLEFIGFVGLIDPPREEAAEAISLCHRASIHVVMITGDHPATGMAIAKKLGIISADPSGQKLGAVITGNDIKKMPSDEFRQKIKDIRVYARVTPEQKMDIVKTLKELGEFVAMTGDGINDAPALKQAHIGIAMGKMGTDVAREAAQMVLLDDNFATIVKAAREGRRIFDNIRKFVKYTLTSNAGEIWTIFLAPFFGLPIPLLPLHILWVNLVTDGLPGIALAAEPAERDIMNRPPRPPSQSIFADGIWQHTLWVGLLMGIINLGLMAWAYHSGRENWQSMVFTVLTLSQMGHALAVRSEQRSLFSQGLFSNLPLLGAVLLTFLLQMLLLYVPLCNDIFRTGPLSFFELSVCLAASTIVFLAVEMEKILRRKGLIYKKI